MNDVTNRQHPILRFWEAPAFEPIVSWTILANVYPPERGNLMVRRVIGSKFTFIGTGLAAKDLREDISLPNAQVDEYYIKPHEVETLNLYQKIPFQVIDRDNIPLDATEYGMETCGIMAPFKVEWWDNGPNGWRELVDWAIQTMRYLSKRLDRFEIELKDSNQLHPPDYKIWTRLD